MRLSLIDRSIYVRRRCPEGSLRVCGESAVVIADDFSVWESDEQSEPDYIDYANSRVYECPRCGGLADELWVAYREGTVISCTSCEMLWWWDEDGDFCWYVWNTPANRKHNPRYGSYSVEACSRYQAEGLLVILWDKELK